MNARVGRQVLETAAVAALYFGLGQLCLQFQLIRGNSVLIWPPAGLALAALLIRGMRLWPGVTAGTLLIELTLGPGDRTLLTSVGVMVGNTLAPVVGCYLLTRRCGFQNSLDRLRDVLAFLAVGVLLGTAITALVGPVFFTIAGISPPRRLAISIMKWFVAHAQAEVVLTPLLLAWAARPLRRMGMARAAEALLVAAAIIVIAYMLFITHLTPALRDYPLTFALYPVIVWAALRFGQVGSTTAVALVSAFAVWGTSRGRGPFGGETPEESIVMLFSFLTVLAVVAMVLTATTQERGVALSSLSQAERQYKTLFDNDPDGILILDLTTLRPINFNDSLVRLLGYSRQELLQLPFLELESAETTGGARAHVQQVLRDGGADFETRLKTHDDRRVDVAIRARTLVLDGRRAFYYIIRDMTDRKLAELAIRASEQKYRFLFEENVAGVFYSTVDGIVRGCNEAFARTLGYDSPREAMSAHAVQFYANPEARNRYLGQLTAAGTLSSYEIELRRKDGAPVWVIENVSLMRGEGGERDMIIGTLVDITERRMAQMRLQQAHDELERRVEERTSELVRLNRSLQLEIADRVGAERALRESEERFRQLCDAAFEGLAIHEEGRIIEVNDALAGMFGYSRNEMIGMARQDLIVSSVCPAGPDAAPSHQPDDSDGALETWGVKKDGSLFPIEYRGKTIPYRGRLVRVKAVRDLTERHRAQEEADQHREDLAHVLRLATMGEMATGLAHELNQPLAAIVSYTQGCSRRLRAGDGDVSAVVHAIDCATQQGQKAGEIIKRMRDFARKRSPQTSAVDVNLLVRNAVAMLAGEARKAGVSLDLHLARDLPALRADAIQIEQVVINLVKNACEAAHQAPAGRRVVEVATQSARAGEIEVCVRDSGPGLSVDAADRIFEPFFTTKPGGMGMGLSISRSIVGAHGGRMEVRANPDAGVTLAFVLPVGT